MQLYVNCCAAVGGNGTKIAPFRFINDAAKIARPGNEIIVAPGIYREAVDPVYAGTKDNPIVYRSEVPRAAVITGSEIVKTWQKHCGTVWKAEIPNHVFGDFNPYTTPIAGDWFNAFLSAHTGEVYLNDKSLYETSTLEEVMNPHPCKASWDSDFSVYKWYTHQESDKTVIYANFHQYDPNQENTEINVRRNCFYPSQEGIHYIHLSGFKVCRAATQWAPPTAYQEGMIGPHWSKGWVIEDCEIYDSKCSGISLGKHFQPDNDNKWLKKKTKDGTQTQRECVCYAIYENWDKEHVGSHTIRGCDIHDCGQTGIVGHLGCVFSVIEDNHIHHINNKQNLAGAEIGGIKFHAAIDVIIRRNHFHHCTRGLWLDWQTQGTRVTQNLFHHNTLPHPHLMCKEAEIGLGEDLFVEIAHGPTLIDNNIFLSDRALKLPTQGVALLHNLIGGSFVSIGRGVNNGSPTIPSPRYTPYHVPHNTKIAGFMTVLHGDIQIYNNIFIQQTVRPFMKAKMEASQNNEWDDCYIYTGTMPFDSYMTRPEWEAMFDGYCGHGSAPSDRYYLPLPVAIGGNQYFNGAAPCRLDKDFTVDSQHTIHLHIAEENGIWQLRTNLNRSLLKTCEKAFASSMLWEAIEPEQKYEMPDGSEILFDHSYFGTAREGNIPVGPFAIEDIQETMAVW